MTNPVKNLISSLGANIFGGGGNNINAIDYGGGVVRPTQDDPLGINQDSKRPTARLDQDPFAFSTLSYPKDVVNNMESGHYMLFYVNVQDITAYEYDGFKDGVAGKIGGVTVTDKAKLDENAEGGMEWNIPEDDGDVQGGVSYAGERFTPYSEAEAKKKGLTFINSEITTLRKNKPRRRNGIGSENFFNNTRRITDSVAMYLPAAVKDDYGVDYTPAQTGLLGLLAATGGGMIGDWKSNDFEGFLRKGLAALSGTMLESIKRLGLGVLEGITGTEGALELSGKIFSRAQNPYLEVLFNSPKMRSFSYSFTMAPKDEAEQLECKRIIKLFRFHMAPEVRPDFGRFMTLPAEFDIHYMYQAPGGQAGQNPWYNKIATCVLTNCSVDYTSGGVKSHADGSPVVITMTLSFMETEMITSDHVEAGY